MTIELSSFSSMWSWLVQHFVLFFQWTNQITIGGLSLLRISIGLTVLTIVIAVVLPIIRTAPVDTSGYITRSDSAANAAAQRAYRDSYEAYAERRSRNESFKERYDRESGRFD